MARQSIINIIFFKAEQPTHRFYRRKAVTTTLGKYFASEAIRFDYVFVSPQGRAQDTAHYIVTELSPRPDSLPSVIYVKWNLESGMAHRSRLSPLTRISKACP